MIEGKKVTSPENYKTEHADYSPEEMEAWTPEKRGEHYNQLGRQIDENKAAADVSSLEKQRNIVFEIMKRKKEVIPRF